MLVVWGGHFILFPKKKKKNTKQIFFTLFNIKKFKTLYHIILYQLQYIMQKDLSKV
jgi:hypothetical protein